MCAVVKTTESPAAILLRPAAFGLLTSLPRKAEPRMLVIRTSWVSKEVSPVTKVSLTKSPILRPRISTRSSTSSMPSWRRISSMFSSSTIFAMIDLPAPGGLIQFRDLRVCSNDVSRVVCHQKKTMRDNGGRRVRADEDIDAITVVPEFAHLDQMQTGRLTKAIDD